MTPSKKRQRRKCVFRLSVEDMTTTIRMPATKTLDSRLLYMLRDQIDIQANSCYAKERRAEEGRA